MYTLRKRIFIGSGIVVGVIIAIFLFVFLNNSAPSEVSGNADSIESDGTPNVFGGTQKENVPASAQERRTFAAYPSNEQIVRQTARMFVERFSSFSNQNDNSHIEDARVLATPRMRSWLETQKQELSRNYEGLTTQVLAISILDMSDIAATVYVETQQSGSQQKEGNLVHTIFQKKGRVDLIRLNNQWQVDGFFWEK